MKNILLIANYLPSQQESMQRFTAMLEQGLSSAGYTVNTIRPEPIACNADNAEHGIKKWLGYIDRFLLFKAKLKKSVDWADIVHICDHSNAMYAKWINKPTIVTCHDLLAIKSALGLVEANKTALTGRILQRWIIKGLNACDHIVCVSKNTNTELINYLNIQANKTSVAYNALNYPYTPMPDSDAWKLIHERLPSLKPNYFFHLGGNQWYKNRSGVVEIFSCLIKYPEYMNHKLVLAGKELPPSLINKIEMLGIRENVIEITNLSNEEIRALYSTTTALIFPSLEEGFGWPIAEAQACGCKVITTKRAPMTEVGGDEAIYILPQSPIDAAEIIRNNLNRKASLSSDYIDNASRFSLKAMITSYSSVYKRCLRTKK